VKAADPNPVEEWTEAGKKLRNAGKVTDAIAQFTEARRRAHALGNVEYEAKSLILIGSAQTLIFQYKAALDSFEEAAEIGRNFDLVAGSASGNMANLYRQLGDFPAAEAQSRHAIERLQHIPAGERDEFAVSSLSRSLLIHAALCFQLNRDSEGYRDYQEAFLLAEKRPDFLLEAQILDDEGSELMHKHRTAEADIKFQGALSLSSKIADKDGLAVEKEHLAELELQRDHPDCRKALGLIDDAFASNSPSFKSSPQYYPINIRGRILLWDGKKAEALSEFRRAVNAADEWRHGALPGDTSSTRTVSRLQEVYADYARLAAETALDSKDNALAIRALEVLAENRAASLREQLRSVYGNSGRLPDEYYAKLAELQAAQAAVTLGQNTALDQAKLTQIRLDISNLENKIGIKSEKVSVMGERIPRRNSLSDIQHTLGRDQVLISITLGKGRSYVWAVTSGGVNLARLPGEEELTSKADAFAAAVRLGRDAAPERTALARALFANLPADVWKRSEWMMVADGPLLNGMPFCALSDLNGRPLIEDKTLRFLPSELLLTDRALERAAPKTFVGVGDPIYNLADPRLERSRLPDAKAVSEGVMLNRLVASGREVRAAAEETRASDAVLLTGATATRGDLTAALARHAGIQPGILHFAVHVVSPPGQPQEAALALSLRNGMPELLTPEAIAALRVPGSLVVLSGCSSGLGKVVPGAGLQGLSRAWLLAGAAAVVVSNWPTPDDSGQFFSAFYNHFDQIRSGDTAQRAALALRRTQLDMLHGAGYQTSPQFWGAFAVIAKE
jgi:CHAT domain-containing protein